MGEEATHLKTSTSEHDQAGALPQTEGAGEWGKFAPSAPLEQDKQSSIWFGVNRSNYSNKKKKKKRAIETEDIETSFKTSRSILRSQTIPEIWCFHDNMPGDRSEVVNLAVATGLPFREFVPETLNTPLSRLAKLLRLSVQKFQPKMTEVSTKIQAGAPYPDILLVRGPISEECAIDIVDRSSDCTITVVIGEPTQDPSSFDLILAGPTTNVIGGHAYQLRTKIYDETGEDSPEAIELIESVVANKKGPIASVLIDQTTEHEFGNKSLDHLISVLETYHEETDGFVMFMATKAVSEEIVTKCHAMTSDRPWLWMWNQQGVLPWGAALHASDCGMMSDDDNEYFAHAVALGKPILLIPFLNENLDDTVKQKKHLSPWSLRYKFPQASVGYREPTFDNQQRYDSVGIALSYIDHILAAEGYRVFVEKQKPRQKNRKEKLEKRRDQLKQQGREYMAEKRSNARNEQFAGPLMQKYAKDPSAKYDNDGDTDFYSSDPVMTAEQKALVAAATHAVRTSYGYIDTGITRNASVSLEPPEAPDTSLRRTPITSALKGSGKIAAPGDRTYASAAGRSGKLAALGDRTYAPAVTGRSGKLAALGDRTYAPAVTGRSGKLAALGDRTYAPAAGRSGKIAALGDRTATSAAAERSGKTNTSQSRSDAETLAQAKLGNITASVAIEKSGKPDAPENENSASVATVPLGKTNISQSRSDAEALAHAKLRNIAASVATEKSGKPAAPKNKNSTSVATEKSGKPAAPKDENSTSVATEKAGKPVAPKDENSTSVSTELSGKLTGNETATPAQNTTNTSPPLNGPPTEEAGDKTQQPTPPPTSKPIRSKRITAAEMLASLNSMMSRSDESAKAQQSTLPPTSKPTLPIEDTNKRKTVVKSPFSTKPSKTIRSINSKNTRN